MAHLLAFAGSNSSTSINYKLVAYTVSLIPDHKVQLLDMHKFPFPMFSEDLEREEGYSNALRELYADIRNSEALILSVNEHNGQPSAYFKNLVDWLSRIDRRFLEEKPILLMATSNGKRGAKGSMGLVEQLLLRFGALSVKTFSLPEFSSNFEAEKGILDTRLTQEHKQALDSLLQTL